VAAAKIPAQPIAQIDLKCREIAGQLGRQVEEAMVDSADLDTEPASGHVTIGLSKARHAERHSLE
jgi:hypothetical protein